MGAAKLRGTEQERKAQGIAKRQQAELDRAKAEAEYEASLTPEQRLKRKKARATLAMITGLTVGMNSRR